MERGQHSIRGTMTVTFTDEEALRRVRDEAERLETQARRISEAVNARITEELTGRSPYEWRALAERIAEEDVPTGWEWTLAEAIGVMPRLVLLQYDSRA